MPFDMDQLINTIQSYYWPFMRISALLMVAPIFGGSTLNVRTRVLFAVFFAALITPVIPNAVGVEPFSGAGLLLTMREVAIGLVMGFTLQLVFAAVVVAGETLAMSMGLGFAMSIDPQNGVQVPVVSQLNLIFATLLFLAIDGHLMLLSALGESFIVFPINAPSFDINSFYNIVALGGKIFASALLLAIPALTAVLMINIAFGVITRAAPQLNIFAVGFPVTLLAGFFLMMLSLPMFLTALRRFLEEGLEQVLLVFV